MFVLFEIACQPVGGKAPSKSTSRKASVPEPVTDTVVGLDAPL